jgi:hypothetical protein
MLLLGDISVRSVISAMRHRVVSLELVGGGLDPEPGLSPDGRRGRHAGGPGLFGFLLPGVSRQHTGRRVGWMKVGHRWTWFVGLYAASVAALAFATLALKRILALLT